MATERAVSSESRSKVMTRATPLSGALAEAAREPYRAELQISFGVFMYFPISGSSIAVHGHVAGVNHDGGVQNLIWTLIKRITKYIRGVRIGGGPAEQGYTNRAD